MKNKLLLLLLFVFFTHLGYSQTYTSIPDSNFERALDMLGYDNIPNDGQVLTADIETIIDLDISNENISDLTGIEAFRDLQFLNINDNSIINLDLTGISNLFSLEAKNNGLGSLDVSTHTDLNQLQLDDNNLNTLDLSNNTNLIELWLQNNSIVSIDLSNNSQLLTLAITNGNFTSIDLTNNTNLSQVFLNDNQLTELDASTLSNLNTLNVEDNRLTILNLKNGNTNNIANLNVDTNPDLFCILVDDADFAEANFSTENPFTLFTETGCYTAIPDANFEAALNQYDDIPNDGQVPTGLIFRVQNLSVQNASIQDLTGIEAFTELMVLTVANNPIQQLDLTNNTFLQNLEAQNCNLQTLNVAGLPNLMRLQLTNNALTSLDLTTIMLLNEIDLSNNNLESLNLKNGNSGAISQLDVRSNPNLYCVLIDDINILNNPNVLFDSQTGFTTETYCRYTAIPDANFESALNTLGYDDTPNDGQVPTALIEEVTNLNVQNASITDLTGIADFEALIDLTITGNNINTVDLSNNTQLQVLIAMHCNIHNLNLTGLTNLFQLTLQFNSLTSLDLSTNPAVSSMNISLNDLSYLNLQNGNNAAITLLEIRFNSNLECVLLDDLNVLTTATVYNDSQTNFTTTQYCGYTAIPDTNFEAALEVLGYDDISNDGQVPTDLIENLTELDIRGTNISDLTGIEDFVALTELDVSNNNLTTISLTTLTNLEILDAQSNIALTSLDLSGNTQLKQLIVEDCSALTTLDLSTNILLELLFANQTNLSSITFGNLTNLSTIDFDGANFISLDVSSLTALTLLDVSGNQLISLNIANGNNSNFISFDARNNTNLRCIVVDDPAFATANFTNIDAQTEFRQTSCYTAIPDANFEAALTALDYDDIPNDGQVPTYLIEVVTSLDVRESGISSIVGIEDFTALETLNVNDNIISSLDISNNVNLKFLRAVDNRLTTLDITNNILLEDIRVEENNLASIDLTNQPNLTFLQLNENDLSAIDLSANPLLIRCRLSENNLTTLDLTNNPSIRELTLQFNNLEVLDMRSGGNTNLTSFRAFSNPNLTCVFVDDAAYSTANWINIDPQTNFSETDYCRYTAIPDANFEAALENLGYDDISGDGQVPTALIESVIDLDVQSSNISNLTGIEDFVAIEVLNYDANSVLTVDLSNNTALRILYARSNGISSIDVSANTNLRLLFLTFNNLTSIDVSNNVNLTSLWVQDNLLTGIDISNNPNLINFGISNNQVTDLDLSNNVNLVNLFAANNSLMEMDLSLNSALVEIGLASNNLESVNVRNGNNTIITKFNVQFNPNLTCVSVDDAAYSTANWDEIDAQTNFTETGYCRYTTIPDAFFENALDFYGYDDISGDGQVPTALIENIVNLEMINIGVADLTGIQDFAALEELNVTGNSIDILDLSANINLIKVNCEANGINSINLTGLTALEEFIGRFNGYTALDVSTNTSLITLYCNNTGLTSLDVSNLTALIDLNCSASQLTSLDVRNGNNTNFTNFNATNNSNLTCILVDDAAFAGTNFTNVDATASFTSTDYCRYTAIPDANFEAALSSYDDIPNDGQVPTALIETVSILDIANKNISDLTGIEDFAGLDVLFIANNNLTSLDVSNNTSLLAISGANNNISSIDFGTNTICQEIFIPDNNLSSIDVTGFTSLRNLILDNNPVTSLDLSTNTALRNLTCVNCNLSSLNVQNGNNTNIITFDIQGNSQLTCVQVDDAAYSTTNWTSIDAQTTFSDTYCRYTLTPDINFENELEELGYDDIPNDGQVPTALIETVTDIEITGSGITDVTGIEDFIALEELSVVYTSVTSLDVSNSPNLRKLFFTASNIITIDLSNNPLLERVRGDNTPLENINLTGCILLDDLDLSNANLSSIDLSTNIALEYLELPNNQIEMLDLSNNLVIDNINLQNNQLTFISFQNNISQNIPHFNATQNPDLTCILIDSGDTFISMPFTIVQLDPQTTFSDTYCRYTAIPDTNFEAALEALGYDDISNDGQVPTVLIETVTVLDVNNTNISDLTGIEDFAMLENLNVRDNFLITMDISQNTALTNLNTVGNNLTALDITNNPLINDLRIEVNAITTIDLSNQPDLKILQINNNQLTTIDVSNNPLIERFRVNNNNITSIDLSNNTSLLEVRMENNQLEYVNIQNGANTNITLFGAFGNPNLTCILVDDVAYSTANWTGGINATTSFSDTYCRYTAIPDANFEAALEALGYDDISADGQVPTALIENITSLDIQGQSIADLKGIEDFTALGTLRCTNNLVTTIDLSALTNLTFLWCDQNQLTALDLSNNTALRFVNASQNTISSFNGTGLNLLEVLSLWSNQLSSLNLSDMTALIELDLFGNLLTSIDVSTNILLQEVNLRGNGLTTLDLSNNTALIEVDVRNNNLTNLNIKNGNNTSITSFAATSNSNLTCILVDDALYSLTNWTTIDSQTSFSNIACFKEFTIDIKVYLQGAALNPNSGEETLMRDDLRVAGFIPTTSPYGDGNTCEATVFDITGDDAIVDWIWVELRDASDNTVISDALSALLQRDGDIVATDGISALDFATVDNTYYVAIKHRNHMGIMSANAATFNVGTTTTINFKNFNNAVIFGSNSQTDFGMPTGIYGMWCGNANGDTIVQYSGTDPDTPDVLATILNDAGNFLNFPTYSITEYNTNDVNMDGIIQYSGTNPDTPFILQNVLAHPENFLNFSTYQIREQLPENITTTNE
ncbi:MAG: hypothetical protein AAF611_15765 [Bacteroidota bacterium]